MNGRVFIPPVVLGLVVLAILAALYATLGQWYVKYQLLADLRAQCIATEFYAWDGEIRRVYDCSGVRFTK